MFVVDGVISPLHSLTRHRVILNERNGLITEVTPNSGYYCILAEMETPCTAGLFGDAVPRILVGCMVTRLMGLAWATPQVSSDQQKQASGTDSTVYRVGDDVKAPRPLSTPLPMPPART